MFLCGGAAGEKQLCADDGSPVCRLDRTGCLLSILSLKHCLFQTIGPVVSRKSAVFRSLRAVRRWTPRVLSFSKAGRSSDTSCQNDSGAEGRPVCDRGGSPFSDPCAAAEVAAGDDPNGICRRHDSCGAPCSRCREPRRRPAADRTESEPDNVSWRPPWIRRFEAVSGMGTADARNGRFRAGRAPKTFCFRLLQASEIGKRGEAPREPDKKSPRQKPGACFVRAEAGPPSVYFFTS